MKGVAAIGYRSGKDALGNMQRISNDPSRIPEALEEVQQKLENVQRQFAIAKEKAEKSFVKEAEFLEKLERLAAWKQGRCASVPIKRYRKRESR